MRIWGFMRVSIRILECSTGLYEGFMRILEGSTGLYEGV